MPIRVVNIHSISGKYLLPSFSFEIRPTKITHWGWKYLSSSSSTNETFTINAPSKPTSTWQRSAKLVKNTDTSNEYLEHIRAVHDPSMHIKTIEDELKGTIGKALGKQGEKILMALRLMKEEKVKYDHLIQSSHPEKNASETDIGEELRDCVLRYNEYRHNAKKARWELLVHRQAVGFIVNNHKIVHEQFPIGDPLPIPGIGKPVSSNDELKSENVKSGANEKKFGDQLDWWQRIGRWR